MHAHCPGALKDFRQSQNLQVLGINRAKVSPTFIHWSVAIVRARIICQIFKIQKNVQEDFSRKGDSPKIQNSERITFRKNVFCLKDIG